MAGKKGRYEVPLLAENTKVKKKLVFVAHCGMKALLLRLFFFFSKV